MIITDIIAPEDKKKKRKVYIDGEYTFSLYSSEIRKYQLKVDQPISNELVDLIFNECLLKRAKKRGLHLLEKKDYTVAQMRKKLIQSDYSEETVDKVIDYLAGYSYLDDLRYARAYVNYKKDMLSRRQIITKLMERGINKNIIDQAFFACEELEDFSFAEKENELLIELFHKKTRNLPDGKIIEKEKNRIINFLLRRGFEFNSVIKLVNEYNSQY